jgi:hypothetical protein
VPTSPSGLESTGVAILNNAISNGTGVEVVIIMTFDYYDRTTYRHGGGGPQRRERTLHQQLASLYPSKSRAQLWAMEGNTLLPYRRLPEEDRDHVPGRRPEAVGLREGERDGTLSIWAIERDNGGCPGVTDFSSCSGIVERTWDLSHLLEPFTGP